MLFFLRNFLPAISIWSGYKCVIKQWVTLSEIFSQLSGRSTVGFRFALKRKKEKGGKNPFFLTLDLLI